MSLCRDLRPRFDGPIVMLTSLDSDMNQILSLELGANDYILKTTPPPVLLARLRVQFRQHQQASTQPAATSSVPQQLQFGLLRVDGPGEMCGSMARALPSRPPTLTCSGSSPVTRAKS